MVIALIIVGIITLFWIWLLFYVDNNKKATFDVGVFFGAFMTILLIIDFALLYSILESPQPTAMDVYQGKTTLEYTIRDSVKIDSIVILKDSIYGKEI